MDYSVNITVANCRGSERTADLRVYCGRGEAPPGLVNAHFGNPFTGPKASAILQFEGHLLRLVHESREWVTIRKLAKRLTEGKTIQLFCWCHPKPCHCEVIRKQILQTIPYILEP